MKTLLLLSIASLPMVAAVDGIVSNVTTGKPQGGVAIVLVQPSERGMESLGKAVSTDAGTFSIDKDPPQGGGPILLQSVYAGVTYTKLIAPGQPRTGVRLEVFESSPSPAGVGVNRHGILLEPAEGKLAVREFIFVDNTSKKTYNDPANGTYRFWAPDDARIEVSLTTQGGMPVKRPAKKSGAKNTWTVDYPIRPGQTQIEISYEYPNAETFSGNVLHKEGETRLIVPKGLSLKGTGLEEYAPEPQTQAAIYGVKNGPFTVAISGTPAPRESRAAGDESGGAPEIAPGRPRIYDRLYWILGITAAILLLGLLSQAGRKSPTSSK
jgi:hypothetical protein